MSMANRMMNLIRTERLKNKLILYSVVVFLLLSICYIIYHMFT